MIISVLKIKVTLQAGRTIPIVIKTLFLGTSKPHMKPLQAPSTFNHSTSWILQSANAVKWKSNVFECLPSPPWAFATRNIDGSIFCKLSIRWGLISPGQSEAWLGCGHALCSCYKYANAKSPQSAAPTCICTFMMLTVTSSYFDRLQQICNQLLLSGGWFLMKIV